MFHKTNKNRSVLASAVFAASMGFASQGAWATEAYVYNGNDAGEGSLRAALESGAREIFIETDEDIMIMTPLVYSGVTPLEIYGSSQTVRTTENIDILVLDNGANLFVNNLNFAGPGGWSIENRGDDEGETAGKGIFLDIRDDQTSGVYLTLSGVTVSGVANHGIHVSDCDLADDCGSGSGGAGGGSPASIVVNFFDVTVEDVGNGKFDADGLRVDERGEGSILFTSSNSTFTGVGADGVELDEGQDGGIGTRIANNTFSLNGNYCDPAVMEAFLPDPDEAEFEDGTTTEADIPGDVTGSPDDSCIEREVDFYESGFVEAYAFGLDLDDGIDLDEAGPGSIRMVMGNSTVVDNLDEGVDIDEEGEGHISIALSDTVATGNTDDGFKFSEEDGGSVIGKATGNKTTGNGGKGSVYEEADAGDLDMLVERSESSLNDDSDNTGIEAVQEDAGTGSLTVRDSNIIDGIDVDGVTLVED